MDDKKLKERDRIARYFDSTRGGSALKFSVKLYKLGKLRNSSVGQYYKSGVSGHSDPTSRSFIMAPASAALILIAAGVRSASPGTWLPYIFLIMLSLDMVVYFKRKAAASAAILWWFSYLARMTETARKIGGLKCEGIDGASKVLKEATGPLRRH